MQVHVDAISPQAPCTKNFQEKQTLAFTFSLKNGTFIFESTVIIKIPKYSLVASTGLSPVTDQILKK